MAFSYDDISKQLGVTKD
ncbi:hypothetical protein [Bacillus sp. CH30_1T]